MESPRKSALPGSHFQGVFSPNRAETLEKISPRCQYFRSVKVNRDTNSGIILVTLHPGGGAAEDFIPSEAPGL